MVAPFPPVRVGLGLVVGGGVSQLIIPEKQLWPLGHTAGSNVGQGVFEKQFVLACLDKNRVIVHVG